MEYFTPGEFRGSYSVLHQSLKIKLDFLRDICGCSISLSDSDEGFARYLGDDSWSTHNIDKWLKLIAVDGYIPDSLSYKEFYDLCYKTGFTGIGLYHGWPSGRRGFHVDIRPGRDPIAPARWGAEWNDFTGKNEYTGLNAFLEKFNNKNEGV